MKLFSLFLLLASAALTTAKTPPTLGLSLWMSASTGDATLLKNNLAQDASSLNVRGSGGQTPLMAACLHGHAECVLLLLEAGADPNIGEDQGYTCLHGAGFQGRASVIRAIASSRFSEIVPNNAHEDGFSPVHRACWGRETRHSEALAAFFETGVPVNLLSKSNETPQMMVEKKKYRPSLDVIKQFEKKTVIDTEL